MRYSRDSSIFLVFHENFQFSLVYWFSFFSLHSVHRAQIKQNMEVDNKQNVVLNATDVEKAAKEDENKVNETNEEVPKFKPLTAQEMSVCP